MNLEEISLSLKEGSEKLSLQTAEQKNSALTAVYSAINKNRKEILAANKIDIQNFINRPAHSHRFQNRRNFTKHTTFNFTD